MPDWLSQGLITDSIYAALVFIGGLFVGWIRKKESQDKATTILYGLAGSALILIVITQAKLLFHAPQQQVTIPAPEAKKEEQPFDIAKKIREWLDAANYSTQYAKPSEKEKFHLDGSGDFSFAVFQEKEEEGLVHIAARMVATDKLTQLDKARRERIQRLVKIDLLALGVEYLFVYDVKNKGFLWDFFTQLPVDNSTTRSQFLASLFLMKRAMALVNTRTEFVLEERL